MNTVSNADGQQHRQRKSAGSMLLGRCIVLAHHAWLWASASPRPSLLSSQCWLVSSSPSPSPFPLVPFYFSHPSPSPIMKKENTAQQRKQ